MLRDHQKGPEGPSGGDTYPEGPHGLKWEGNQPLVGWCAPLRLGLETLGWGGAPHALGGTPPPWPPPPWEIGSPRACAPLGAYIKEGEGGQPHLKFWRLPLPLLHLLLP